MDNMRAVEFDRESDPSAVARVSRGPTPAGGVAPRLSRRNAVLALQRTAGNAAVSRLVRQRSSQRALARALTVRIQADPAGVVTHVHLSGRLADQCARPPGAAHDLRRCDQGA
jgi:hypothetical protein